ncbi:MAG: hypothetical protein AMXMBFR84_18170 [Candidatus Hydrogenedentota bacterium]
MKTCSALVYCPGYPFDPQALMPDRVLAATAGSLLDAGHTTRIYDYGSVEVVESLVSGGLSDTARRIADRVVGDDSINPLETLHTLWQIRSADKAFRQRQNELCDSIAVALANVRGLHFAAFHLRSVEDLPCASRIASRLRGLRPKLRIVGFGEAASQHSESVMLAFDSFDCLCIGDPEMTLVAIAEKIEQPDSWGGVSNLVVRRGRTLARTPRQPGATLSSLPNLAYEIDIYPALRHGEKLRVFEVEDSRGNPHPGNGDPCISPDRSLSMKPVTAVCHEMWRLGTLFGARAFAFTGSHAPASHVAAVANELIRRGMRIRYTRTSNVRRMVPAAMHSLRQSGCMSLAFEIGTGSQRLLDQFYGTGFTVTEAETVLRASRNAGLFTVASFSYPCPWDDYHTRCETLRILQRTKPSAAPVIFPGLTPFSLWFRDPKRFGFGVDESAYLHHMIKRRRRFPLPQDRWRALPYQIGKLSLAQALAEREELIKDIEEIGVHASTPEPLLRIARLVGYDGGESLFGDRIQRELLEGDTSGIAEFVMQFNEAVCIAPRRVAFEPLDATRGGVASQA